MWAVMNMKEKRIDFILSRGFKNINQFSAAVNDSPSNVTKVLSGKQRPEIEKLFKWADVLHASVMQLLMLFYPDEMKRNIRIVNGKY